MSVFANLQEQESTQASEQHCVQLEKARRELERQLSGLSDRLEEEEACSAQLALHRDRLEAECGSLRRDLDELEGALTVAEQEKQVEHHLIFTTHLIQKDKLNMQLDLDILCFCCLITMQLRNCLENLVAVC